MTPSGSTSFTKSDLFFSRCDYRCLIYVKLTMSNPVIPCKKKECICT